jgi:PucR family transcriptional regulator, purine catabolism regulatory protein
MGSRGERDAGGGSRHGYPSVREVLEIDAMSKAQVVGGAAGLDRQVTGSNIVEVPDVYRWLRGGELLFTAGYAWRDDPTRLVQVLEELDRIGVSALAVKPGQYLKDVPEALIRKADELKLPVIRIPPDLAYRGVMEALYKRLTTQRLWVLERSRQAQELFTSLGLDDQSIEKVTGALAEEVTNPVYVVDMVDDSVVVARPGITAQKFSLDDLKGRDVAVVKQISNLTLKRTLTPLTLEDTPALAASLIVGRRSLGRIAVLQDGAPVGEYVELVLSHGAELISFLLMRQVAIIGGRREAGDLFFNSLLSDTLTDEEAAECALTLGLRLTRTCIALAAGVSSHNHGDREVLRVCVERALSSRPHVIGKGHEGADVVALLEVSDPFDEFDLEYISNRMTELATRADMPGLLVGVGSPRRGLSGVRRSRSEALIAYQVGSRMFGAGLVHFDDFKVERLLAQIPSSRLSRDYIEMTIGRLDDEPELRRTLEVFLDHGGNKIATAAALPMHRSSLAYRLEKISQLLGVALDDPEHRLELWLALRLRRIFDPAAPE